MENTTRNTDSDMDPRTESLTVGDHAVQTTDANMYRIEGLNPNDRDSEFSIYLNADFARALENTAQPPGQENVENILLGYTDENIKRIAFKEDSFLLSHVQIGPESTGLGLYNDNMLNRYQYVTHNVDTGDEAAEIIAIFTKWVDYAHSLLTSETEPEPEHEGEVI